jgi:uncharacterized protein YeeX (DUF496 family)
MQTLIDIEENQLHKLLLYTHTNNGTEAITKIIQDYLAQQERANQHLINNADMQKKRLLQNIQQRFSSIPTDINLADELITERRIDALQELE